MSDEASPRPWRIPEVGLVPTEIWSADGTPVARGVSGLNAALIVDAVNERDRLRDIVRAFADVTYSLIANYEYHYRDDANSMAYVANVRELIRKARAAIGEGGRA